MTENMETRPLETEEMVQASGGTFTRNTYRPEMYHAIGISTSYHFFDKDEFRFMGRSISYDQANAMVELARTVKNAMNTGYRGNDTIGYSEPAFIRAYNSQLWLTYGVKWDGVPGHDF